MTSNDVLLSCVQATATSAARCSGVHGAAAICVCTGPSAVPAPDCIPPAAAVAGAAAAPAAADASAGAAAPAAAHSSAAGPGSAPATNAGQACQLAAAAACRLLR